MWGYSNGPGMNARYIRRATRTGYLPEPGIQKGEMILPSCRCPAFKALQLRFFDAADVNGDGKIKLPPPPPEPPEPPQPPPPPR